MADFFNLFYGAKYQYAFLSLDQELKQFREIGQSKDSIGVMDSVVNELLVESGKSLTDFDAVSVCIGPGSYTGLRVGLSYAKGIAFGLGKRLLTFDYFSALYLSALQQQIKIYEEYTVVLKAREGEYFMCSFDGDYKQIVKPALFRHDICKISLQKNFNKNLVISDAQETIDELVLLNDGFFVTEIDLGKLSVHIYEQYVKDTGSEVEYDITPLYLKEPYIKTKSAN